MKNLKIYKQVNRVKSEVSKPKFFHVVGSKVITSEDYKKLIESKREVRPLL